MKKYLKLMRVHHYIKNLLVFATIVCSGQLFSLQKLSKVALGFIAFCMISSVIYIINDIRDVEQDRRHPQKKNRPLAAGTITIKVAWLLAAGLFVVAIACSVYIGNVIAVLLLAAYFVLNLAYSFGLKNISIVDISIIVAGFLLRILYGAVIADILVSNWLYLVVISVSFYFALGKRRNEIRKLDGNETRKVLKQYPIGFLDKSMGMCLTLANVFYALWSMDAQTIALYDNEYLILSVPIVLLITMKYSLTVEGDSDGDPVEVLLHDKALLILCVLYLLVMLGLMYL